jgi:hypothetical protein
VSAADTLRRAADLLRETAKNATPGPWGVERVHKDSYGIYSYSGHAFAATVGDLTADPCARADADWMAMVSPALAEPLAAWLEGCAGQAESMTHPDDFAICDEPGSVQDALAVARALLGEDAR